LAFLVNKEPAKAVKSFGTAARLFDGNPEFQFYSLFNGGVAATEAGDIPGALKFYQAALELRPDSKEVKTNIELLWKGSGGQGQGQGQNQQPNQDQQQPKDPKDQNRDGNYDQKKQPQPFQSKELSPEDVRKILEELKNQEQKIRAQENEQGQKEAPHGKDW
jgi:tetratricopeptide (TPR) repeat protein